MKNIFLNCNKYESSLTPIFCNIFFEHKENEKQIG